MNQSLKVIVADDEELLVRELSMYLSEAGHEVVATASNGTELFHAAMQFQPDLIITDIKMPGMSGLESAKQICAERPVPIVVVSAYHDESFIAQATQQCVMAYLVKPISEANLKASIALTMQRFAEFEFLFSENETLRRSLEDRKLVERAKGVLMKRSGLDEDEAFERLRKSARQKSLKMADLARSIIDAEELYVP
ncbi:MAG: response regulator [Planctomycetota bacterium]